MNNPTDMSGNPVSTWNVLRGLGFVEDQAALSGSGSCLIFDFGNFKLSAAFVTNLHFRPVVLLFGVMVTERSIREVECELPPEVESIKQGMAWVAWCLDNNADGRRFEPNVVPAWLAEGRLHRHLLPWERERAAYEARPRCDVRRDYARVALKMLGERLAGVDDETLIEFVFNGTVLTICCAGKVSPMPADGPAWTQSYLVRAGTLRSLPKRLMSESVEISVWEAFLRIGNRSYRLAIAPDMADGTSAVVTPLPAATQSPVAGSGSRCATEALATKSTPDGAVIAVDGKYVGSSTSTWKLEMSVSTLLANMVAELRAVPATLSGEDSELADVWEEIKYQVQEELSLIWPAYVETIKQVIDGAVAKLAPAELLSLCSELKTPTEQSARIREVLLRRLLAKARREKVRYEPFDFEYFWYSAYGISIYTQILKRTGMHTCWVLAYSAACPTGEEGKIDLDWIDRTTDIHTMTADDFEEARSLKWPDQPK